MHADGHIFSLPFPRGTYICPSIHASGQAGLPFDVRRCISTSGKTLSAPLKHCHTLYLRVGFFRGWACMGNNAYQPSSCLSASRSSQFRTHIIAVDCLALLADETWWRHSARDFPSSPCFSQSPSASPHASTARCRKERTEDMNHRNHEMC